ncbi:MAG: diaminopimelate decarboxylase [Candidatus Fermentithermobacillus carboniphilus]|uniref:Diaminopimelate decarboxylase n=1 Tax=Candidatus Fermentithermobacillus carboniphilus TaxID=3085328 RepID=A0AAT9LCH1_9FIRM|nr:MAG: diaminopimelate decarboxylase [Candidatus Fermentithermobacillus carboniphilus]
MQVYPHVEIDGQKRLVIGGIEASKLARKFGTPLYVYSEDAIVDRMREYVLTMRDLYPFGHVAYASKAYLTLRMAQLVAEEGLWLDVVSGGELFIAMKGGFPPERIIFHGNNKTFEELEMAVAAGVGRIVIDSLDEIKRIERVAAQKKRRQDVLLRLTPGIDAHTHKALATGEIDSKFGIPMHQNQHVQAALMVLQAPHLNFLGVHCHIGSQIFETAPFAMAVKTMLNFIFEFQKRTGILISELDLGGGLGVPYTEEEPELGVKPYLEVITSTLLSESERFGLPPLRLFVEPGRSIVAQAGVTLYRVGTVKELPNGTVVAAVDGGMADNPRPMLYGAKYRAILVTGGRDRSPRPVRIVGRNCEEGDTLIEEAWLPPLRPGDILAVLVTGAYQYSMSSNYNALPRPAVVHVRDGQALLVVEREKYADLILRQRLVTPVKSMNSTNAKSASF